MDTTNIIAQIDEQISQLQQAKAILSDTTLSGRVLDNGRASEDAKAKPAGRGMSAESKAKIAKAQKARWAKVKKIAKRDV